MLDCLKVRQLMSSHEMAAQVALKPVPTIRDACPQAELQRH